MIVDLFVCHEGPLFAADHGQAAVHAHIGHLIEKMELEHTAKLLNLSLSTLIRRALHNVKIEKKIIVANSGEETPTAGSTLLAQCSKVGGNLNQLARHFNSGGADTEQIRAKILDELADLTAFRLNAEKVLGELYGNAQAYQL